MSATTRTFHTWLRQVCEYGSPNALLISYKTQGRLWDKLYEHLCTQQCADWPLLHERLPVTVIMAERTLYLDNNKYIMDNIHASAFLQFLFTIEFHQVRFRGDPLTQLSCLQCKKLQQQNKVLEEYVYDGKNDQDNMLALVRRIFHKYYVLNAGKTPRTQVLNLINAKLKPFTDMNVTITKLSPIWRGLLNEICGIKDAEDERAPRIRCLLRARVNEAQVALGLS